MTIRVGSRVIQRRWSWLDGLTRRGCRLDDIKVMARSNTRRAHLGKIVEVSVFLVMIGLCPNPAIAQTPETIAQLHFEEGRRLYNEGSHEAALESFRSSLTIVASPNSRLFVARCLRELGQTAEAVTEYHMTALEASERSSTDERYLPTREAAEREREQLLPQIGWLTLRLDDPPEDLQLSLGGREVPAQTIGLPLPVDPGQVEVETAAAGFEPLEQQVTVEAGERIEVRLEMRPLQTGDEPEPAAVEEPVESETNPPSTTRRRTIRRGMLVGALTSATFTLAGGIAFGVLGSRSNDHYDWLLDTCNGGPCVEGFEDEIGRGHSLDVGANVALGVGLAAAVATVIFAVLTPDRRENDVERSRTALSPWMVRW